MARASGYVLRLLPDRERIFLEKKEESLRYAEAVDDFPHSRGAPLLCVVVTNDNRVRFIARGRKGVVAGDEQRRLNVEEAVKLATAIPVDRIVAALAGRCASRAEEILREGGLFTPKAFECAVEAIVRVSPEAKPLVERFSLSRRTRISRLSKAAKGALADQKEVVLSALSIAGMDKREIHEWMPPSSGDPSSFLEGLPSACVREDAMIINDLMNIPGQSIVSTLPYTAARFVQDGRSLTVILANRMPLEKLTGTDLIYFSNTYKSFVMVQYKAMRDHDDGAIFRLPNKDLEKEIRRMKAIEAKISALKCGGQKDNFRLNDGPFFLKLCSKRVFNPDDIKLFPGMYFALRHWESLTIDPCLQGPRGGRAVTLQNAGRSIDSELFIRLVSNGWVGCKAEASAIIATAIRKTVESGRAVALAIEKGGPPIRRFGPPVR